MATAVGMAAGVVTDQVPQDGVQSHKQRLQVSALHLMTSRAAVKTVPALTAVPPPSLPLPPPPSPSLPLHTASTLSTTRQETAPPLFCL